MEPSIEITSSKPRVSTPSDLFAYDDDGMDTSSLSSSDSTESKTHDNLDECIDACAVARPMAFVRFNTS